MLKRAFFLLSTAIAMLVLAGCGGVDAQIATELTTFDVVSINYYTEYGPMTTGEGNRLMVVAMTAQGEFEEPKFKSYFCADDGSSVARLHVDDADIYDCIAVAYQGEKDSDSLEYVLVFEVPESVQKAKLIAVEAPGRDLVALKGKLPE